MFKVIIRKMYADLKSLLIDLEACYRATGGKQPKGVQPERLSEENTVQVYAIVQRTRRYVDVIRWCEVQSKVLLIMKPAVWQKSFYLTWSLMKNS